MLAAVKRKASGPLLTKLSSFIDLEPASVDALEAMCTDVRRLKAGTPLIREGARPESVFLLVEGWAYRYKFMPDGGRQIVAYLIPGDLCDIHIFILKKMDHGISLLSDGTVAVIPKEKMLAAIADYPDIGRALFWSTLVDEATLREWLVNLGQRDAYERVAHLLCEMWLRMKQVGLVSDEDNFALPVTQEQLGDTVGLTAVHVNRVLQRQRAEGLITLSSRQLTIHDLSRLKKIAGFEPNYLHLDRRRSHDDR